MSEGIDGDMQLTTVLMHKADGFLQFLFGEIKAGKVAGVGVIFQPDIDGIGAVFDGRLKRRKVTAGQSSSIIFPENAARQGR